MQRRNHSVEFRAQVMQACREEGASVAAIALRNGLNANMVRRWLSRDGRRSRDEGIGTEGEFLALQMPATGTPPVVAADIRVELRRGASGTTVSWPVQGARECAAWLREWLR